MLVALVALLLQILLDEALQLHEVPHSFVDVCGHVCLLGVAVSAGLPRKDKELLIGQ